MRGAVFAFNTLSFICLVLAVIIFVHKLLFKTHAKEVTGIVESSHRYRHRENEYETVISYTFNGKEYHRHSAFRMSKGSSVKLLVDCNNPRKTLYYSNSFTIWYLIISCICKLLAIWL